MRSSLLAIFLLISCYLGAQDYKRAQNWYFGDSAGLSFATDPPTVLTDGAMFALEGCATISDTAGNLLFYTNGLTVWNRDHQVMKNGTGLLGHESSTQTALIIPQPENDSIFYIFTMADYLRYSVVNINREGNYGEVVEKNIDLIKSQTEKLAATHHANGSDVWVATHGFNNNHFYSFLVTKDGVIPCPVISETGSIMGPSPGTAQGELRFSPSGKKAAISFFNNKLSELLLFNKQSGKFSNPIKIYSNGEYPYGLIFSKNESRLYISERWTHLIEYKIDLLSEQAINNSRKLIYIHYSISNSFFGWGDKIYFGLPYNNYLGYFIPSVDPDTTPEFFDSAIHLIPRRGTHNFPNFISSYFYNPALDFAYKYDCEHDSVSFEAKSSGNLISPAWNIFKNTVSVFSSTGKSFGFKFSDTGEYLVRLISGNDTIAKTVFIEPPFNLEDTVLCNQSSFEISIPEGYRCIQWQDASDTNHYLITESGKYYVRAYSREGCLVSDTIRVRFSTIPKPVINRRGDSLFTDSGEYSFTWLRNGTAVSGTGAAIKISQTGNYRVDITDTMGCSNVSENFSVSSLGVQGLNAEDHFAVYPVPASDKLHIEPKDNIQIKNISLTDITGRKRLYNPAQEIPVADLPKGIYFLTLNNQYYFKIIIN